MDWYDWGDYMNGRLTFRLFLRDNPLLVELREAIEGATPRLEIAPHVPQMVACSKKAYEKGGWQACFVKEQGMKDRGIAGSILQVEPDRASEDF